jgi:hypothetical protein
MQENQPLPEKCCAKCGFLYGLARSPANREDAIFDPDLLRSENIERQYSPNLPHAYARGIITSVPYTKVVSYSDHAETHSAYFTWADTLSICCYRKKYVEYIPASMGTLDFDEERTYVPITYHDVLTNIRIDRQDCDGFFAYFAGFSPKHHAEMRLEEIRAENNRRHEQELTEWSAAQEGRWKRIALEVNDRQNKQEAELRAREARLTKLATWLTVGLLFFAAIQAFAAVIAVIAVIK